MTLIEVTAYDACLTEEPRPYRIIINADMISSLSRLDANWTSVQFGGGPQCIQMKGEPYEIADELAKRLNEAG